MNTTTINQRINLLIEDFCGGNNSKFAALVNTSEANIRNYRRNTSPKVEVVVSICEKFNISYEWLLAGNGPMMRSQFASLPESEIVRLQNDMLLSRERQIALLNQQVGALREKLALLEGKTDEAAVPRPPKMYMFSELGRNTDDDAAAAEDDIKWEKKKKR